MFIRTEEVKKNAIKMTLPVFLEKYSGDTSKEALTKAFHDIRSRACGNYAATPMMKTFEPKVEPKPSPEEQIEIDNPIKGFEQTVEVKELKRTKKETVEIAPKEEKPQPQTATITSTPAKGSKSARITELANEGKTIKEIMTVMTEEGNPIQYSQAHSIIKKLGLK